MSRNINLHTLNDSAKFARQSFSEVVLRQDDEINLAEAALFIAAEEYPNLVVAEYLDKLAGFAEMVRRQLTDEMNSVAIIDAINEVVFGELHFRGNMESYYDPRNSFLNQVIDCRRGIPITLSVIYLDIARRIEVPMSPVGLPGHFLIKHQDETGDLYVDPFNGGRVMIEPDVAELLSRVTGDRVTLTREHLAPATNKQVLTRILANLYRVYAQSMDYGRAVSTLDRMLLIEPGTPGYLRDRGILYAAMNKFEQAIADLERYLKVAPEADDAETLRDRIRTIRLDRARLN
ncbi:MAG: hypothetical protein DMF61_01850 [Blastocatellia bacterium AA13]|nr:MAG: hypothetical protein DMF61_01850 [Blastocatellia bacterium AA13]